jgi:cytoskeletal protein CcmA (bactofilin family)
MLLSLICRAGQEGIMANTAASFRPEHENVVYIGAGVTLRGEISAPDLIVVDGDVEGDVTARFVLVGPAGVIRGRVISTEADVSGLVTDNIDIKQLLVVRSTGRVEGRVAYGEIELEKGAVVKGDLSAESHRGAVKPAGHTRALLERPAQIESERPGASVARLNEAVRVARSGSEKASLYLANEGEPAKRNILRAPLSVRRASA